MRPLQCCVCERAILTPKHFTVTIDGTDEVRVCLLHGDRAADCITKLFAIALRPNQRVPDA
jgi:hypothetical protein